MKYLVQMKHATMGGVVCLLLSGAVSCGPGDSPAGSAGTSSAPPENAVVTAQPKAAELVQHTPNPPQARVEVTDECLAFLMNKHPRASACDTPPKGL